VTTYFILIVICFCIQNRRRSGLQSGLFNWLQAVQADAPPPDYLAALSKQISQSSAHRRQTPVKQQEEKIPTIASLNQFDTSIGSPRMFWVAVGWGPPKSIAMQDLGSLYRVDL
jgi:hypothetical protein